MCIRTAESSFPQLYPTDAGASERTADRQALASPDGRAARGGWRTRRRGPRHRPSASRPRGAAEERHAEPSSSASIYRLLNEAALDRLQALRARLAALAGLPQSRPEPRRPRHQGVEAARGRRLRRGDGEPRPGGLRGGDARRRLPRLRLLPALRLHAYRPRAGAELGRALPEARPLSQRRPSRRARCSAKAAR